MNIHEFKRRFDNEYELLYDSYDNIAGFDDAVKFFNEEIMPKHRAFVIEFAEYRGDIISSDREAAAFSFTFMDMVEDYA